MTFTLHGTGVSRGVAIGKAHIIKRADLDIDDYQIGPDDVTQEILRFREAVAQAKSDLKDIRNQIPTTTSVDITAFIDTHLLMLEDAAITFDAERLIREKHFNASWALKIQADALAKAFDEMDDEYLRTRKDDVDHVVQRIQRILLNHQPLSHEVSDNRLEGMVIVADDLTPADTVLMQRHGLAAFVTESGGPTSHMAILARGLGIPGIVGAHGARRWLRENEMLIVDGGEGVVVGDPNNAALAHYRARQVEMRQHDRRLQRLRETAATTRDGVEVALHANVELVSDFEAARRVGAAGVGLYRTEFLYMNRADRPG